jgi:hypothetical protein
MPVAEVSLNYQNTGESQPKLKVMPPLLLLEG